MILVGLVGLPAAARGSTTTSCAGLVRADFSAVHGVVSSAGEVTSNGHAYCEVRGTIAPRTGFAMRLPTNGWTGRYVQQGCGGFCGAVSLADIPSVGYRCAPALDGELAMAVSDSGHTGADPTDATWGRDNYALRVVFGLTSEHSLARLATAVISRFMLAQRFPGDFDGILAGAPAANLTGLGGMFNPWLVRHNTAADGGPVLTDDKLPALHAAVVGACGNADGIVVDPRACTFDPASLACPAGVDTAACLTAPQVAAVRSFYRGPTDRAGRRLYNGGQAYGSELGWSATFVGPAGSSPADMFAGRMALNYLKYLEYLKNPPQAFTLADVRFTTAELDRLNVLGDAIYNANNPDLRQFRDRGGKLILYHGLADPMIPVWSTIDYYASVERTMGGFAASQRFSRLYLIPGAYHCLVGPDFAHPAEIALPELLTPLMDWVERGAAPGPVTAPILPITDEGTYVEQTVQPFDALTR